MSRVALVTGGTRGLGASMVEMLLAEGWTVVATFQKSYSTANAFYAKNNVAQNNLIVHKCDINSYFEVDQLYEFLDEKFGCIDALINNAGINQRETIWEITEDSWDSILDTNLKAQFFVTRKMWELIKSSDLKRIVFIASVAGQYHGPKTMHYSVSKAGLISMSKVFARYGVNDGIFVNTIAPGLIITEQTREEVASGAADEIIMSTTLAKRAGHPSDVSSALKFLLDPEQKYMLGQVISVSGGAIL